MAILPIQTFPAAVLTCKAGPVDNLNGEVTELVRNMFETMYAAPGVGLAAPQVGVSLRIAVIDISSKESKYPSFVMVNPEILCAEGHSTAEEGCLSLPGVNEEVIRAQKVSCRFYDLDGVEHKLEGQGLLARVMQHEIDHLDGILFVDRINRLKRHMIKKRLKKKLQH